MFRSVISFVVLLAIFKAGNCLKCYQCNSEQDKACGDPFTGTKNMVDCSLPSAVDYNKRYLYATLPAEIFTSVEGAPRYCHKITMATGTVIRTCLDANPASMNQSCKIMEEVSKTVSEDKRIKFCDVCNKDSCNSATNVAFSLPLAFLSFLAAFLLWKQ